MSRTQPFAPVIVYSFSTTCENTFSLFIQVKVSTSDRCMLAFCNSHFFLKKDKYKTKLVEEMLFLLLPIDKSNLIFCY